MECIIDRFEGDYAVVEYKGKTFNLPRVFLPLDTKEGELLDVIITVYSEGTDMLKDEINRQMESVWEK
ncbi:MAG: DUF3006 domain-containing protein [Caulobacteraceae bacterium]